MAHLMIASKDIRTLDGLYSLNDLHKASGSESRHLPAQFLRNQQTKELIAEIDNYANSHSLAVNKNQGRSGGTWVCKELVYAYAMWISPKFNLEVIRAFDQAQTEQPPEPIQQSLPAPIQDDEKLKLINDVAKSLGITESIAVVSATDIMAMIQTIRNYQQQLARIQTNPAWVDQTIERVKTATGRGFGDGI
ncbi:KilA, /APSES-type HTH DNA-binding domain [Marinomonas mediterranea MMB-1]|uniref:KilA, /APSES-type HTH DNA-binding domain n=2 Tax=Marinomonas mediterranea TaxID=119864 RepID=F2K1F2_MARM1|nr:KilA, /APSES-type HTH DNA-binding domain [Marinomonas mediterranea MMB-1]WCN19542.1 KilA-N domain-containing protein [Marinomonas mediterranea MMB-1]